ncbi:MAG: c-type cytochrome [Blastocatellia bacterium]|nr:c-type cytochrome [Blastocatellia bacterium]
MRQVKLFAILLSIIIFSLTNLNAVAEYSKQDHKSEKAEEKKGDEKDRLAIGAEVFDSRCSGCHDGGDNTIEPDKTLKMDALKANGFNGPAEIKVRVKEGKAIMPAFDGDLTEDEMQAVAEYVWAQAQKNWE